MIAPADEVTVDRLTSGWTLAQRRRGHRHSTDDLLTGWYAAEHAPRRTRLLDLGAGGGSVGLLVLWRSPGATLTSVEAQEISFALLRRNVADNGLERRVRAVHGDLRETRFPGETFDCVTGSPPYFPPDAGIVSADSQKAHARFELRGDVRDYCAAARAALAFGGRFVFCFPTVQRSRAERAIAEAELVLERSRDVIPRRGLPALFSLFACRRAEEEGSAAELEPPYVVREEDGSPSEEHARARASFGFTAP